MPHRPDQPHAEIHHEEDGWSVEAFDFDPVRGLIILHFTALVSLAAAVLIVDRLKRLLG